MSGIYWLASYPKSGNTWLRALLTNYRRDHDEPAAINELDGDWTASLRETFDESTGIESADLTRTQIEFYRPGVYEQMAAAADGPLFLKVHDAYTRTSDARPVFSKRATAGVIYLIRNPLDVAVSYAHHRNEPLDHTVRFMGCDDATLTGSGQLPQQLRSWSGHVSSWVDEPALDIHIVRYEDMVQQPVAAFTGIVRFAGWVINEDRVRKAIDFSCFDRLQLQETERGFAEKQPTAVSFFRRGRVGSWREHLTDAHVRQLIADHHDVMRRFGYLGQSNESIL